MEPAHFGVESGAALRDDSFEEEVGGEAECTPRSFARTISGKKQRHEKRIEKRIEK